MCMILKFNNMGISLSDKQLDPSKPGSDMAGQAAAALASGAILFNSQDPAYAKLLFRHARELADFASNFPGKYSDSIPEVQDFYRSWSGYNDEIVLAEAWLGLAAAVVEPENAESYKNRAIEKAAQFPIGSVMGF